MQKQLFSVGGGSKKFEDGGGGCYQFGGLTFAMESVHHYMLCLCKYAKNASESSWDNI